MEALLYTRVEKSLLSENSPHHNLVIYEILILPAGKYSG